MFTAIKELEKSQKQIESLEDEVKKAKEHAASMAKLGPSTSEPVQPVTIQTYNKLVASTAPINNKEHEQELVAQEALRSTERNRKNAAEEDKWRMEETLRKAQASNDQLKEKNKKLTRIMWNVPRPQPSLRYLMRIKHQKMGNGDEYTYTHRQ